MAEAVVDVVANDRLRQLIRENSMLLEAEPAGSLTLDLIHDALAAILQPGEEVLAYVDRELSHTGETDALAYVPGGPPRETDAFAYTPGGPPRETDALAYDERRGREQPDVLGYDGAQGPARVAVEADAFAYDRPPENPETNAFISPGSGPRPAEVDLLALTDRRLIRGILRNGRLSVTEAGCRPSGVRVVTATTSPDRAAYLAFNLPALFCGQGEGEWWYWRVPEGKDPWALARAWGVAPDRT